MIRIKLCGLTRPCDIEAANRLLPDYIGFVFAPKSRRFVSADRARALRKALDPSVRAVGVFVRETPEIIAGLLNDGVIYLAQLHGGEDERFIARLRTLTDRPVIRAFRVDSAADLAEARRSTADYVLLDSGAGGTGTVFDWRLLEGFDRPFFLAGGLGPDNAAQAAAALHPYAMDVSSGIETDGVKDEAKMRAFVEAVRSVSGEEGRS